MSCLLVMADVHSNLAALEAVLADVDWKAISQVWYLGDLVGYGPDPNECIARVRALPVPVQVLAGNHDWAAIGQMDVSLFNPHARAAALWTRRRLTPENAAYLASLPIRLTFGDFTLVHGSPRQPVWEYIQHPFEAQANFAHFATRFCLVSHTHVPVIFYEGEEAQPFIPTFPRTACSWPPEGKRAIVNCGSIGQPRDGDPRACYMSIDLEERSFEYRRLPYPIALTQKRMREAGLPEMLIARLDYGW